MAQLPNALPSPKIARNGRLLWLTALFCFAAFNTSLAWHIAGAELTYECLGSNAAQTADSYRLRLKLYRDCSRDGQPNVADYDDIITLFLFEGNTGNIAYTLDIPKPAFTPKITPPDAVACLAVKPNICLQEGIYERVITLPRRFGGYNIGWQRCCRNEGVKNLVNSAERGITYLAFIPGPEIAGCNSMPEFNARPPIFLCINQQFTYDHSATDADGDSLVYRVTRPFDGLNFQNLGVTQSIPVVSDAPQIYNLMGPPPYLNCAFNSGYSFQNPFGLSSTFNIDSQTGFLEITPKELGLFTVAISVFEYRNGVLISENKRDMQFTVIQCKDFGAPPTITRNTDGLEVHGDTIIAKTNLEFCYTVTVEDVDTVQEVYTEVISDVISKGGTATVGGLNPQTVEICWKPNCDDLGKLFRVIVLGRDPNDCRNHNTVYDTIYIKIEVPVGNKPTISTDFGGGIAVKDTLIIELNTQGCFDFTIQAPQTTDSLQYQTFFENTGGQNPTVNAVYGDGQINGTVCWTGSCAGFSQPMKVRILGTKVNGCPPNNVVDTTVFIRVTLPPNPPPVLTHDLTGLSLDADTVLVYVGDEMCYDFTLDDTPPGAEGLSVTAVAINNQTGNLSPSPLNLKLPYDLQNDTIIKGRVCWKAPCAEVNRLVKLYLIGFDNIGCGQTNEVWDSVWVRVLNLPNPKPTLSVDLSGLTLAAPDTILLQVKDEICFTFQIKDTILPNGTSILDYFTEIQLLTGGIHNYLGPLPTWSIVSDNVANGIRTVDGRVCWTGICGYTDEPLRLVFRAEDSTSCEISHIVYDTVYLRVSEPPNPAPDLQVFVPPNSVYDQDTILLTAREPFCFRRIGSDIFPKSLLGFQTVIERLNGLPYEEAPPTQTDTSEVNEAEQYFNLYGTVCWTPPCAYLNETLRIIVILRDESVCDLGHQLTDTLYVRIVPEPAKPVFLTFDFATFPVEAETVKVFVKQRNCVGVNFLDPDNGGALSLTGLGALFDSAFGLPQAFLKDTVGLTNLNTFLCWRPTCEQLGQTIPVTVRGVSKPYCQNPITIEKTFYFQVVEPENRPPVVSWESVANTLMKPGIENCFTLTVEDPDTFTILSARPNNAVFEPNYGFGSAASFDTTGSNPIEVKVCVTPNCNLSGETYTIDVCGVDSTLCTKVETVCAQLTLTVDDCFISFPNVFTPNGDGYNETFGPDKQPGVEFYELSVFDRWGVMVYQSNQSGRWDGQTHDADAQTGVYYFVARYKFWSGTGKVLQGDRTGAITLIR